jgi:hypothetical protein
MQPVKCPQCGAPANVPPGAPQYQCTYCKQVFATGMAPPPPAPFGAGQHQRVPQIIVIGPGHHLPDDDADDHRHHHYHAAARSVGTLIWIIGVLIVVLLAGGGGGVYWWLSGHSPAISSLVWDGKAPFECGGNDNIAVKGVTAELSAGTAVTVNGNCHFTCTDCTIRAPIAIDADDNGVVMIVNGTIEGSELLAQAGGNARVNVVGNVKASGAVKQSGNARVSAPKAAASASASASAPAATITATAPAAATTSKPATKPTAKPKATSTARPSQ